MLRKMKYQFVWIIYWLNYVSVSFQYPPPTYRKVHTTNVCDGNKAALVEHFFTVIFSEFRNPSPVCVCVQMCVNQATYCYPNGCLKKSEDNKRVPQESRPEPSQVLRVENKKPMFLVDNAGSQVARVNEELADTTQSTTAEPYYVSSLQKYAFDNYKTIYKYRKLPKVQLQYNLREQVKNTKSNIYTDVASNRWPLNKMKQVTIGKSYQPNITIERAARRSNYFRSIPSIVPRFSKRDLRPSENQADKINSDVDKTTQAEIPEKFSLEKLINDLIESSIDNAENSNNSAIGIKTSSKNLNNDLKANLITPNDRILPMSTEALDSSSNIKYETTAVTILNDTNDLMTNKTLDYEDDSLQSSQAPAEMFQNIYNDDSIESLSKRIDKLNNTSYEILINDHVEAITEDSRSTEVKKVLSPNCTKETEEKSNNDDDTSKNSTSLLNNN